MDKFRLLPEAEKDLESIWQYTAKNWGVDQADYYIDGLVEIFKLLSENISIADPVRIHYCSAFPFHEI